MVAEQLSYSGATIFWLYNVFALLFTGIVVYTIYQLPGPSKSSNSQRHDAVTRLFTALSVISFSVLSANMLNVLIQSFSDYRLSHSSFDFLYAELPARLYHWSLTTPLFHDFGEAILANPARCLWTQAALVATFWVCLFMASKGQQLQVPRLWAFFALSQILPISFAQNLFYLALLRLTPRKAGRSSKQVVIEKHATNVGYQIYTIAFAYFITLLYAPTTVGTARLMSTILLARALLLSPLVIVYWDIEGRNSLAFIQSSRFVRLLIISSIIMTAVQAKDASAHFSLLDIVRELASHPAVSALGMDFVLCTISLLAWIRWGRPASDSEGIGLMR